MDTERFDSLARSLAGRLSRRIALRGGVASGMAGLLAATRLSPSGAQSPTPTSLPVCTDPDRPGIGCACTTGVQDPCGPNTLVCCATEENAPPGSPGICTSGMAGCHPRGPQTPSCTSHGCRCNGGVENGCDSGLICCPDRPDLPGGPGRCVQEQRCNQTECKDEGCICQSGTRDACDGGLVCCAHDSSVAGGSGRCEDEIVCFSHQCQATTNPCPSSCPASNFCEDCCSGYCGAEGHCAPARCEGIGCPCRGGVEGDCSPGLVCCQSQMTAPNEPGGPGMCAAPEGCGGGDESTPAGS
jgi:hypothetical protein